MLMSSDWLQLTLPSWILSAAQEAAALERAHEQELRTRHQQQLLTSVSFPSHGKKSNTSLHPASYVRATERCKLNC